MLLYILQCTGLLIKKDLSGPNVSSAKAEKACFSSPVTEKAMAPHSSTLAWKIPWMEEPGRLQSIGWLRIRHD